jgi:uncharacterized protein YpbB
MNEMAYNLASLYVGRTFDYATIMKVAAQQNVSRSSIKRHIVTIVIDRRNELMNDMSINHQDKIQAVDALHDLLLRFGDNKYGLPYGRYYEFMNHTIICFVK